MSRPIVVAAAVLSGLALVEAPARADHDPPRSLGSCSPTVELLGFSDALDKTTFAGTDVGGLSGLAPLGHDRYRALVDNQATTPARAYELKLRRGEPRVTDLVTLSRPDGTPYTGADFDGEGLVTLRRGFLASSETEPSIRRFGDDGNERAALGVPPGFGVAPAGQATRNQTFESLTLTADGRTLFTAVEGPLSGDGLTADGRARIRVLRYERTWQGDYEVAAQHHYVADAGLGVVDMLAVDEQDVLVLERGFVAGVGNTVRIYRTSFANAGDATGTPLGAADAPLPVYKQLVADLANCPPAGATNPGTQPNPLLDNYEALAYGERLRDGRRELLVLSDDNFGAGQVTRLLRLGFDAREPKLLARATLSATAYQPGPPSGAVGVAAANGVTPPFPGQPIPGFSAVLDGPHGTYYAMPDNGFGAKANSADFLLRLYVIEPRWKTSRWSGGGEIKVRSFISLRDPDHKVPFPIVNEDTDDRLLTGADFDLESVRRSPEGDLWFGEEFGPYVVHTDAKGRVLEAPFPLPGVKSPFSPDLAPGEQPTLRGSNGFEGMALSADGRMLYPALEGALIADPDQRRRIISEFDLRTKRYTGRTWQYRTENPGWLIGDFTALDRHRFVVIERDNGQGAEPDLFKRIYTIDLREVGPDGFLVKHQVLDLMRVRDPRGITAAMPGWIGLGDPFSFPLQSVESVLPLGGGRLLVLNDNNFPGNAGRFPGRPDDTEGIVVEVPALR
jgi:hypothetical protein